MRSEDDYCKTYFIDSRLDYYLKVDNARHYLIPDYFKDAINIKPTIIKKDLNYPEEEKPKDLSNNKSNPKIIEANVITLNNENTNEEICKDNLYEYDPSLSFNENVNNKILLKQKALILKSEKDYSTLIDYLNLLIENSYFINDYYPYRQLCIVYELMDEGGPTDNREPYFREAVEEMMRARVLCARANAKMPDDPTYVNDLEELFGSKLDDVRILTPFICDFGNRVKFGKGVFLNHSAILSASGGIEFEDGVMSAPGLRIASINHDMNERHT